jgi:nitrogen fixation protein FixH
MKKPFRITGRHVLFSIVGFFLIIIAVNAIFITLAVQSFPGEQEKKSYLQGLRFNDKLEAQDVQKALGWTAEIMKAEIADGSAVIEIYFSNSAEEPLYDLGISGFLSRPADDDFDREVAFSPAGPGRYTAVVNGVEPGVWLLKAEAISLDGETFAMETKLYF